jgi:transposase
MSAAHSLDLRERVIEAYCAGEGKAAIARRFIVGYATVRRYITQWLDSGSVAALAHGGGMPRKVDAQGEVVLVGLVRKHPDATDEELARLYAHATGCRVGHATVNRTLARCGLTRKKSRSTRSSATPRR